MMKTEKMLRASKNYSWFYLLFAFGLILLTIFSTPYTQGWVSQSFIDSVIASGGGGIKFSTPLLIWIASFIYLVHFLYGFFYYPAKYKKYLKANKVDSYSANVDLSYLRGTLAAGIILSILWTTSPPSLFLPFISFVWLLLNYFLFRLTRTYHLFSKASVFINKGLLPEDDYRPGSANKNYTTIKFYWPKFEDRGDWENKVIIGAIKEYNKKIANDQILEKQKEKMAEEKTREILSNVK